MWKIILFALIISLILLGMVFVLLQTQYGKKMVADAAEHWFNDRYEGELEIGSLEGTLPFWAQLDDVTLTQSPEEGSGSKDTLVSSQSVEIYPNWNNFYSRNFSIRQIRITGATLSVNYNRTDPFMAIRQKPKEEEAEAGGVFRRSVYIPQVAMEDSRLVVTGLKNLNGNINLPDTVQVRDIAASAFIETEDQSRFVDFEEFSASLTGLPVDQLNFSGQFYSDPESFEFNGFRLEFGESSLLANVSIEDFESWDRVHPDNEELHYRLQLRRSELALNEWAGVFEKLNQYPHQVSISGTVEGPVNHLNIDNLSVNGKNAELQASGTLDNLFDDERRALDMNFSNMRAGPEEVNLLGGAHLRAYFDDWEALTAGGRLSADRNHLKLDSRIELPQGRILLDADVDLRDSTYHAGFEMEDVNSSDYPSLPVASTRLNGSGNISGRGFDTEHIDGEAEVSLVDSYYDNIAIDEAHLTGNFSGNAITTEYNWRGGASHIEGRAEVTFSGDQRIFDAEGRAENFNLELFRSYWAESPSSSLNLAYEVSGEGAALRDFTGYAQVDVETSEVNGTSIDPHQMYLDVAESEPGRRSLRLTSTFFDLVAEGRLDLVSLYNYSGYWGGYLYEQFTEEVMLSDPEQYVRPEFEEHLNGEELELEASLEVKDVDLLRRYYSAFPDIETRSRMDFNLSMSRENFLLSGGFQAPEFLWDSNGAYNINGQLLARFEQPGTIRENAEFDFGISTDAFRFGEYEGGSMNIDAILSDGFLESDLEIDEIGGNFSINGTSALELREDQLYTEIRGLQFGEPGYLWELGQNSELVYSRDRGLSVSDFTLVNDEQVLSIEGIYSSNEEDEVAYRLENIQLGRISELIDGRVSFAGTLSGEFFSRTLTNSPFFEGGLTTQNFAINGRPMGEVVLESNYNAIDNRFDTRFAVHTDPDIYADYLETNDGIGNDIELSGYFVEPNWEQPEEEFFYFDGRFDQIDMWILEHVVTDIFEDVEGEATGEGYLSGSLRDIDFNAELDVLRSAIEPVFFATNYDIRGDLTINRDDGVTMAGLDVVDEDGGTGRLSGNIGFNDFETERHLDMTLEMDGLRFLANDYDPEIPFYGTLYGTGTIHAEGTNVAPVVTTSGPIDVSSDSNISVPLTGASDAESQRQFIEYVTDFSEAQFRATDLQQAGVTGSLDRSFTEQFTLDLEFDAPEGINVELIFDPVTGEVLTSQGSGRVRITLDDEEYGMMGRYDITTGSYRFVGGDLFTRRFSLREGGSIIWDGDPANARLDITAAYRSRPDINALLETGDADMQAQRVPVDLILEITGTIESVENDFYFEFPNTIDATQNAAVLSVLNSEDQKLLQATALLLTGGFIPVGQDGFAQAQQFSSTVQARVGEVGLSQLVSAQINELLNTNLANIDIDFNMMGFDQADLGIALRLFDDRLELRRDGQVTGEQANIGDLGATYKINPTFSVEVFHRKDPTLIGIIGPQAQQESVNGVGLEAQLQFNTWQELRQRVFGAFRRLFGASEAEDEDDEEEEGVAER